MLDLQPGVHLEEIEVAVLVDDELDRAGALVVDGLGQRHGLLAHRLAGLLVEKRRRRLLDDLLVAALDRAFALAEIDGVAMRVGQHLDLDMARIDDELLDEDAVVAEGGFRLVPGRLEALARLGLVPGDAHALAAAAGRCLQHHGIADLGSDLHRMVGIVDDAQIAGNGAHFGGVGELLRFDLVAHRLDGSGLGSDEDDAFLLQRRAERGALGQEAVARVHGLGARRLAGRDDLVADKIAFGRRRGPDMHRLVRHLDMDRVAVGVGIDGHRRDTHPARRLDDPAGDFATVGDQNLLEHGRRRFPAVFASSYERLGKCSSLARTFIGFAETDEWIGGFGGLALRPDC